MLLSQGYSSGISNHESSAIAFSISALSYTCAPHRVHNIPQNLPTVFDLSGSKSRNIAKGGRIMYRDTHNRGEVKTDGDPDE